MYLWHKSQLFLTIKLSPFCPVSNFWVDIFVILPGYFFKNHCMSKHGKVLVAMSGGIDSTVTAMLLHEEGYEVIGITMKTWDYANSGGSKKETGCCSLDSINDAREVAVSMGFHHFIIDIRDEFGDFVIDNFVEEYIAGRTPNPCVLCNTHIKWNALLKRANALDCEFIATGHYAQSERIEWPQIHQQRGRPP